MKILRLLLRYVYDSVRANFIVAKMVLSPRMEVDPEVIEIETNVETPGEVLVLANLISFTPGSLTLVIEPKTKRLVIHFLSDGADSAAAIRKNLESPLLEITRKDR